MITIGLSYKINKDYMSELNFIGFLLCMSGIVLHVYVKVRDVSCKFELLLLNKKYVIDFFPQQLL